MPSIVNFVCIHKLAITSNKLPLIYNYTRLLTYTKKKYIILLSGIPYIRYNTCHIVFIILIFLLSYKYIQAL